MLFRLWQRGVEVLDRRFFWGDLVDDLMFWWGAVGVIYLLTTKSRFIGCGGVVMDIIAVAIDGLWFCD